MASTLAPMSSMAYTYLWGWRTPRCRGRGRQCLTTWLTQPTNASNPNRFYVGATSVARAVTGDGGGLGTEKGGIFGGNDVATLAAAATRMAAIAGREINVGCETGSSVLDKYG